MEFPEILLLGTGALVLWYLFKLFSDWLVSKLLPTRGKGAAVQDHFLKGLTLLQDAEKSRQSMAEKATAADVASPGRATSSGLNQRRQQSSEKLRAAVAEFDSALKIDPNDASTRMIKAVALDHLGDVNGCLSEISRVIEEPVLRKTLQPAVLAGAYFKRANLYLHKKRKPNLGISDLEAALMLVPSDFQGMCLLAQCYEAKKMYRKSEKIYNEVLKEEPGFKEAEKGLDRVNSLLSSGSQ